MLLEPLEDQLLLMYLKNPNFHLFHLNLMYPNFHLFLNYLIYLKNLMTH